MLTLYGSIGSRASRCLWTAEEIGLPYAWQPVSTLDGSNQAPAYRALVPSGKIPALTDGDVVMTESMGINHYLAQRYGAGSLWPDSPALQAAVLQWTFWSATEVEPFIGTLFPQLVLKPPEQRDMALVDGQLAVLLPKLAELERALTGRDYLLGRFTLADIQVAVQTFVLCHRFGIAMPQYPQLLAWTERCRARPARQKVEALAVAVPSPR